MAADVDTMRPDVMIVEFTSGTHVYEKRED